MIIVLYLLSLSIIIPQSCWNKIEFTNGMRSLSDGCEDGGGGSEMSFLDRRKDETGLSFENKNKTS